jgi:hypothetical protein
MAVAGNGRGLGSAERLERKLRTLAPAEGGRPARQLPAPSSTHTTPLHRPRRGPIGPVNCRDGKGSSASRWGSTSHLAALGPWQERGGACSQRRSRGSGPMRVSPVPSLGPWSGGERLSCLRWGPTAGAHGATRVDVVQPRSHAVMLGTDSRRRRGLFCRDRAARAGTGWPLRRDLAVAATRGAVPALLVPVLSLSFPCRSNGWSVSCEPWRPPKAGGRRGSCRRRRVRIRRRCTDRAGGR